MNQESESGKIKEFTDLTAWQKGHQLALATYSLTRTFPKAEIFGLTNQMRRAAVSITSNLAEGFGRYSYKEKAQFYSIAQGSVSELRSQLLIAKGIGLLNTATHSELEKTGLDVSRLISGLVRSSRSKT